MNSLGTSCRSWVVGLALVGSLGCDATTESTDPSPPLRVAVNPWPGYAFLYLAEELKYFQAEGLDVRLLELSSLADVRRVVEQGGADVMSGTLVEVLLINDRAQRMAVKCVVVADYSNGADVLLARNEIQSLADLKGKRIGVEPESLDSVCVHAALDSVGLDLSDVTLVPMPQVRMGKSLRQGLVDAVQMYPPGSTDVRRAAHVHSLWDTSQTPAAILDVLAATTETLARRPAAIRQLARAYFRAQKHYFSHQDDSLRMLSRRLKMSREELAASFAGVRLLTAEEQNEFLSGDVCRRITARTAESLRQIGMIERPVESPPFQVRWCGGAE